MQQRIGLPMGTNCSPFMANLVLFMYELEYFVEEISKCEVWHCDSPGHELQHQHDRIRRLAFCTRYIDDLWNPLVSANEFKTVVKAIYPSWLELGLEHKGETVNYLDMTIWNKDKKWHSKLYDKKLGMIAKGLKLNRFPHPCSKLAERCKYGVITSQLHRYNVVCTGNQYFIEPALSLYAAYIKKGYVVNTIDKYFEKFIRSYRPSMKPNAIKVKWQFTKKGS